MLLGMTRLWCVVLVGAVALPAVAAPRGRVVRVERTRATSFAPRICEVRTDQTGMCLGARPEIGDLVSVIDESGVVAQVRVTETSEYPPGSQTATCEGLWGIKSELVRGDLSVIPIRGIGVLHPEVHPRKARVIPREQFPPAPSGRSDEQTIAAVDRDGDRVADIVVTQSTCGGSAPGGGPCLDQYAQLGGRMVHVYQINLATCGL